MRYCFTALYKTCFRTYEKLRGYLLKKQNFFNIPPYRTDFFDNSPPPPPHPILKRKVKYGQYDEIVQRFNVKKRKLRAKGNQSFSDCCIAGVKKRLLKLQVLKLHTGVTWPLKFNNNLMQSSLDWFGT